LLLSIREGYVLIGDLDIFEMVEALLNPLSCLAYVVGFGILVVMRRGGSGEQQKTKAAKSKIEHRR